MKIYKIIKDLRQEKGLSAKDVANYLGLSTNMIYEWEHQRCEPSLDSLIKLSQLFQVSVSFLLGIEDDFGAVNVTVTGDNLSSEEKELIKCYRKLDFDQQRTVRIQIGALVDSNV